MIAQHANFHRFVSTAPVFGQDDWHDPFFDTADAPLLTPIAAEAQRAPDISNKRDEK